MVAWIIGVLLILLGFAVKQWPNLIAGYQQLPEAKRKKIDVNKLTSMLRNMLVLMGSAGIVLHYVFAWFNWYAIQPFATSISIFFITPLLIIRLNEIIPPRRPKE